MLFPDLKKNGGGGWRNCTVDHGSCADNALLFKLVSKSMWTESTDFWEMSKYMPLFTMASLSMKLLSILYCELQCAVCSVCSVQFKQMKPAYPRSIANMFLNSKTNY